MTDVRDRFRAVDDLAPPELWPEIRRRAAKPGDAPSRWDAEPRSGRLVAGLVALALFLGGVVVAMRVFVGDEPARRTPAADPWAGVPEGWTRLPDPPFRRSDPVAVWADDRLILWGGGTDYNANLFADGAVFDPTTGAWTPMSDSPLAARAEARAVWTGDEVLVWGGFGSSGPLNDGAAYDPETDTWRGLPAAPWQLPWPAAFTWTGSELVLFGSTDRSLHEVSGMAYDPERDSWRTIASAPMALNQADAVWTGDEVLVYGTELDGRNRAGNPTAQGIAYRPVDDTWRVLPERALSPQATSVAWTGSEMLAWDYETDSALYDPVTNSWRAPANRMPFEFAECYPFSVRTSATVFAWFCGLMGSFDIATDRWEEVEPGPVVITRNNPLTLGLPVGAGDVVLVFLSRREGDDNNGELAEMWAYRAS
jgi:N-acetylneuraminic acid mutarotase